MLDIVLDTNCLIASISRKGRYFDIWKGFQTGKYRLCVTTEILEEYEEIISRLINEDIASSVIQTLVNSQYVRFITVFYNLAIIQTDWDDNKFVDCAAAANADYIDAHFHHLNEHEFPYIPVIRIGAFMEILHNMDVPETAT